MTAVNAEQKQALIDLIIKAGEATLPHWTPAEKLTGDKVQTKGDNSPITQADRDAHAVIMAGLKAIFPDIPVISEEDEAHAPEYLKAERFFLVDPVDGTKEFINGRKEFTVNIALCRAGSPIFGLVYAPALETLWGGDVLAQGAWKTDADKRTIALPMPNGRDADAGLVVVASLSHANQEALDRLLGGRKVAKMTSIGSSLKLCLVATGEADIYPRQGPTMFWDTAAAHAVVLASGARVSVLNEDDSVGPALKYADESLRNPWFLVER